MCGVVNSLAYAEPTMTLGIDFAILINVKSMFGEGVSEWTKIKFSNEMLFSKY